MILTTSHALAISQLVSYHVSISVNVTSPLGDVGGVNALEWLVHEARAK